MRAWHSNPAVKQFYLERIRAHTAADEITQGHYWQRGKGCHVGCMVHVDMGEHPHAAFERETGITEPIARLFDRIFEGLSPEEAKLFPLNQVERTPVGANLSLVPHAFAVWVLTDPQYGVMRLADDSVKDAIDRVAQLHQMILDGTRVSKDAWENAIDTLAHVPELEDYTATGCALRSAYSTTKMGEDPTELTELSYCARYAADAYDCAGMMEERYYCALRDKLLSLIEQAPIA